MNISENLKDRNTLTEIIENSLSYFTCMKGNFFSSFYKVLSSCFVFIGSIIGAGFITGKEIKVFFCSDYSLFGFFSGFIFMFAFVFLISYVDIKKFASALKPIISFIAVIIAASLVSALDLAYSKLFHEMKNFKILTIITVIFVIFISFDGLDCVRFSMQFLVPFTVIFVLLCISFIPKNLPVKILPCSPFGLIYPVSYVGFNALLCAKVVKELTSGFNFFEKIFTAFISSFILFACVFVVSSCVLQQDGAMPLAYVFDGNAFFSVVYTVINFFSIFSSLTSSVYTAFSVAKGKRAFFQKTLISLLFIRLSKFGFSSLIEKAYPVIGALGVFYFVILVFWIIFSRAGKQARTLDLPKRIKQRSKSSQGLI